MENVYYFKAEKLACLLTVSLPENSNFVRNTENTFKRWSEFHSFLLIYQVERTFVEWTTGRLYICIDSYFDQLSQKHEGGKGLSQVRGKGSKLGEAWPKIRLSQERLPIEPLPHMISQVRGEKGGTTLDQLSL